VNTQQARTLVSETFPRPFDKGRFRQFAVNLLNRLDESKAQSWNSTYVKDAFKIHVARFERLGTYISPEDERLDVLVVYLTTEAKLERARTAIRNFVADHLKQRDEKDAALVAFVSPTERHWRFSYVKMEYAAVEKDDGTVGVETHLTPARRLSYIVGEGESCHTAQSRFVALLQDTENYPTLAQIEDAFSVEAVTKEFFNQYAALFVEIEAALRKLSAKDALIRKEFDAKNVSTVDFAKKLMGQIVFLYFLQKKGWLGVAKGQDWGTGPRDFLRRMARGEYGPYNNFFNDVLEPLFYDTLATDRGHDAWCSHFECRLPFLNGGLFEPLGDYDWRKTNILLPNRLFTNTERNDAGDMGTGVLDVFDRYNFTVNEAEPLEKEVAIDPEMLGKVFENLIEENRRKGLGSYYTPREIVHYMCQESLIDYLDTALNNDLQLVPRKDIETFVHLGDQISHYEAVEARYSIKMPKSIQQHAGLIDDKLADLTICDPAVGSGAFPVGMMTEVVRARCALTPYFDDVRERTPYNFKRHAIQHCLYGVDIDPGAVEIAKLRLWLSLVVDEEDVNQVKPLPNLDYKLVTGNSLMGFPFKTQRLADLEKLKRRFFDETDHAEKASLKVEIDAKLAQCFAAAKKSLGYEVTFDYETLFSEVFQSRGGFDVVIGNPPYVSYGLRGGQTLTKEDREFLKSSFPDSAEYKISLYAIFMEKGIRLCHQDGGITSLIVPDSFVLGMYFSKIRSFILRQCQMNFILLLPFSVFKAVVGFSVVYQFARRKERSRTFMFTARTAPTSEAVESRHFDEHSYPQLYFQNQKRNKFRLFFNPQTKALVEKCREDAHLLEDLVAFRSGLIGKDGQDSIVSMTKASAKWRPGIVSGGEIRRYSIVPEGYHLLYDPAAIKSGYECVEYFRPKLTSVRS
jgi:type I restriction-modification system DNA methylase subunit